MISHGCKHGGTQVIRIAAVTTPVGYKQTLAISRSKNKGADVTIYTANWLLFQPVSYKD